VEETPRHTTIIIADTMPINVRLLQITDSALPIGGYMHSWGLETAINHGKVNDPASLERWTREWLWSALGPMEGVFVASSCRAALNGCSKDVRMLNQRAEAMIAPPSIRGASKEMGEQLISLGLTWSWSEAKLKTILQDSGGERGWHHSIAFGMLGALAGDHVESVVTAFLHQAALGMISAGVRAIPVGHTHGQQVLSYIHDEIPKLVSEVVDRNPDSAGSYCPFYEVLCDEQTRLYARMFRC